MRCHLARLRGLRYCGIPDCDVCYSPEQREMCDCGAELTWWEVDQPGVIESRCSRCEPEPSPA